MVGSDEVELDAGVMDGDLLLHGAVGAVQQVRNPIQLAAKLLKAQAICPLTMLQPPS